MRDGGDGRDDFEKDRTDQLPQFVFGIGTSCGDPSPQTTFRCKSTTNAPESFLVAVQDFRDLADKPETGALRARPRFRTKFNVINGWVMRAISL